MKRRYADASVEPTRQGFVVALDGKPVKTPAKRLLAMPTAALAELVAAEWVAQEGTVRPAAMPVNRLATTAVDLMPDRRSGAIEQVADYARTDLLCYRAAYPADLVALQTAHWDPPLAWLRSHHGIRLDVAHGLMPHAQPEPAIAAVAALVAQEPDWPLVALHAVTTATGSVVLGLMVQARALGAAAAGAAALVDERYERAQWGEEADALDRERRLLRELDAVERYLDALAVGAG